MKNIVNSINESFSSRFARLNESAEDPRELTNNLIDAVEGGLVDWETVGKACLKYVSEDDVRDMCRINDFAVATLDDLDESLNEKLDDNVLNMINEISKGLNLLERHILSSNRSLSRSGDDEAELKRARQALDNLRNYLKNK